MRRTLLKLMIIFIVFFTGTGCLMMLDNICRETTGEGGKLVLNVEKLGVFN